MRLGCAAEGAQPTFVNEAASTRLRRRALHGARGELQFTGLGADGVGGDGAVERVADRRNTGRVADLLPDQVSQRADEKPRHMTREERQPPLSPLPRRGWTGLISSGISRISRHEPAWPRDHRRHHDASSASGEVRQSSRRGARGVGAVGEQDEVARQRDLVAGLERGR